MKPIYFAPLEGIGNQIYRGVFTRHYSGVDRFYTPFIDVNSDGGMKSRNRNDILPENNKGICLIPQVLTKNPAALGEVSKVIAGLGYEEINLNMGCPSGTVTKKGKGAGMLADVNSLEAFLTEAFAACHTKLSVKMRIGVSDPAEWEALLDVLNRFPLTELIVHPRLMTQMYAGEIREDIFRKIYETSKAPVCLNPGIRTPEEFARFEADYPDVTGLMIGRGLVSNPELAEQIRSAGSSAGGTFPPAENESYAPSKGDISAGGNVPPAEPDRKRFFAFHDDLLEAYRENLFGDTPVLHKMKELWVYWEQTTPLDAKIKKSLSKVSSVREYEALIRQIR